MSDRFSQVNRIAGTVQYDISFSDSPASTTVQQIYTPSYENKNTNICISLKENSLTRTQ
jgi:hypothetical protein